MSRPQRQKKGARRKQADRQLSVRAVRQNPPDLNKLSRAFVNLALARAQAEADALATHDAPADDAQADQRQSHGSGDDEVHRGR